MIKKLSLLLIALPTLAVASPSYPRYEDALDYLSAGPAPAEAAYESALNQLGNSFNDICGDTFCEGDYGNLTSLGMTCSADSTTGELVACSWTFAGSNPEISQVNGQVTGGGSAVMNCAIDVKGLAAAQFGSAISAGVRTDGLDLKLPGKTVSIYDQLVGCL